MLRLLLIMTACNIHCKTLKFGELRIQHKNRPENIVVGIFHAAWKLSFRVCWTEKVNCENTSHALFATRQEPFFRRYLYPPFYIIVTIIIIGRYFCGRDTVVMHQKRVITLYLSNFYVHLVNLRRDLLFVGTWIVFMNTKMNGGFFRKRSWRFYVNKI